MRHTGSIALLVFAAALSACSHNAKPAATGNAEGTTRHEETVGRRRADLITPEEIASKQWSTVYEMISELRPRWLSTHGPDTINSQQNVLMVHLDGTRYGDVTALYQMPVVNITFIQYYPPNEASARWGFGYNHGAIDISTHRK